MNNYLETSARRWLGFSNHLSPPSFLCFELPAWGWRRGAWGVGAVILGFPSGL